MFLTNIKYLLVNHCEKMNLFLETNFLNQTIALLNKMDSLIHAPKSFAFILKKSLNTLLKILYELFSLTTFHL